MSEGLAQAGKGEGEAPQAGGMPVQAAPAAKKFFLFEYIDEVRKGFRWMRTSPKPDQPITKKVSTGLLQWTKLRKARVGMIVVLLIMGAAWGLFSAQAAGTHAQSPSGGGTHPGTGGHNNTTKAGSVSENAKTSVNVTLQSSHLASLNITLTWSDEPAGIGLTNQPDQLGLAVTAPNGKNWSVAPSASSPVKWSLNDTMPDYGPGDWNITVVGGTMGDVTRAGGLPGPCPRCSSDSSNAWSMTVDYSW